MSLKGHYHDFGVFYFYCLQGLSYAFLMINQIFSVSGREICKIHRCRYRAHNFYHVKKASVMFLFTLVQIAERVHLKLSGFSSFLFVKFLGLVTFKFCLTCIFLNIQNEKKNIILALFT